MSEPVIHKPIPRRPFDMSLTSATPPSGSEESDYQNTNTNSNSKLTASNLNLKGLLGVNGNSHYDADGAETPSTFARTKSILNLTGSTLFGIYSPTFNERGDDVPSTPFGTGALTPLQTQFNGSAHTRPQVRRARSSQYQTPHSLPVRLLGYLLRSTLLFALGMGYGLLVTHLHNEHRLAPFGSAGIIEPSYNLHYLVFWGIAGVLVGSALPLVDDLWEDFTGESATGILGNKIPAAESDSEEEGDDGVAAKWTPVVRSVGAFVGIAFAIRKLPWTSTLQISLTLAMVNPFLWYLVDRSKPGFLLSLLVGAVGTTGIMAFDSGVVPNPLGEFDNERVMSGNTTSGFHGALGGVHGAKIDSAIWIMSVLFCSVLCFGHIGRRLALLRRSARAKQA